MILKSSYNQENGRSASLTVCFNYDERKAVYTVHVDGPGIYDNYHTENFAHACKTYDRYINYAA